MLAPVMAYLGLDISGLKANAAEAKVTMDDLGNSAGDSGKLSQGFKKLGAVGVAAMIGLAVASVHMSADFQTNMTKLVTSAGETQANLGLVSNGVLDLAVSTGTSTTQLASGLYTIESAGYHGAAGLNVLKAAAQGARAEGADLGDVANAVTSALNAYHLPASQAVAVTDELVATVASGKTDVQALSSAISSVLPVAAAAHISFAQVGGAVATMTMQGMSADQATQDLAFTIRSLQSPSTVAQQAMAAVGLSSQDLSNNLGTRGLTGTMALVSKQILEHMGPDGLVLLNTFNQSQTASQSLTTMLDAMPPSLAKLSKGLEDGTTGAYAYQSAVKALPASQAAMGAQFETLVKQSQGFTGALKNGSSSSQTFTAELSKVMGGATGLNTALMISGGNAKAFNANVNTVAAAAKTAGANVNGWSEIQGTFNFKLSQLREVAETTGIRIGTVLIPVIESAVSFFGRHQDAALALAGVIGGVLVSAMLTFAASTVVATVRMTALMAETIATNVADWAETAAITAMYIAEGIASAATAVLDAVMIDNPIGLIVVALIALGVAVYEAYEHVSWFREGVQTAFRVVGAAAEWLWHEAIEPVIHAIVAEFEFFVAGALAIWDDGLKPTFAAIGDGAMFLWHDVFEPVVDGIGRSASYLWSNIIEPVGNFIIALIRFGLAVEFWALKTIAETVWKAISAAAKMAWDDDLKPTFDLVVIATKAVGDAAMWLWDSAIEPSFVKIGDLATWLWDDAIEPAWNKIGDVIHTVWTGQIQPTWHMIESAVSTLGSDATSLWKNDIVPAWDGIGDKISDVWHRVIEPVFNAIEKSADQIVSSVGKIVNLGKTALNGATGGLNHVSKMLGFADGGWVPGAGGAAQLAVVHGGEYVLSRQMIEGTAPIDASAITATAGSLRGAGGGPAPMNSAPGGAGGGITIIVNGSVMTDHDLVDAITQAFTRAGMSNTSTWMQFAG